VTWTTVGYGDFRPSEPARLYAASEAMVGYLFMGLFISCLFQLLTKIHGEQPPTTPRIVPPPVLLLVSLHGITRPW
jgi:hypothetical protein